MYINPYNILSKNFYLLLLDGEFVLHF